MCGMSFIDMRVTVKQHYSIQLDNPTFVIYILKTRSSAEKNTIQHT